MDKEILVELCEVAINAAKYAGAHIQRAAESGKFQRLKDKEGGETEASQALTEVDLQSQRIILEHVEFTMSKYSIGLLAEEGENDDSRLKKDSFWAIDPMDGTLAFIEGKPGYSVSIALINRAGEPLVGVVYLPFSGDLYACIKGEGILLNGEPFKRPAKTNEELLEWYADGSMLKESNIEFISKAMIQQGYKDQSIVGCGAVVNAIKVMNAAKGCYFKLPVDKQGGGCIWDFAATNLFFKELGLPVTDMSGNDMSFNHPESIYMNHCGVLYASSFQLQKDILVLNR